MADGDKTYTEVELKALVADGVSRETASLTEKAGELTGQLETANTKISELETKVAGLEAEKAAAEKAKEQVDQEFAEFKSTLEQMAETAKLTAERVEKVKAAAKTLFGEDYYTDERAAQWASMSEEVFADLLDTITTAAAKVGETKTEEPATEGATEQARETAAFTGGQEVKAPGAEGDSLFGSFLAAGGLLPQAAKV